MRYAERPFWVMEMKGASGCVRVGRLMGLNINRDPVVG